MNYGKTDKGLALVCEQLKMIVKMIESGEKIDSIDAKVSVGSTEIKIDWIYPKVQNSQQHKPKPSYSHESGGFIPK